jgi:glycosyltransferase involved in cell wall biosynthesis
MKILHMVGGSLTGGAAIGARILHDNLLTQGIKSKILTNSNIDNKDNNIATIKINIFKRIILYLIMFINQLPKKMYPRKRNHPFSVELLTCDISKHPLVIWADIIHLHWVSGFMDVAVINKIKKPIVWTLRDMNPMTGGCHHSLNCMKYKSICGSCPQLSSTTNYDLSRYCIGKKVKLKKSILIIGISRWITKCAKDSTVFKNTNISYIPNAISTSFHRIEKLEARRILNINTTKKILLFGAYNVDGAFKGYTYYKQALTHLDPSKYYLLFFGARGPKVVLPDRYEYKEFGYLNDSQKLNYIYNASDVFVCSSVAESFGKTVAEAMRCGVPAVSFKGHGVDDIIDHKTNGYLAKYCDCWDLKNGIEWVVGSINYATLSINAENKIKSAFTAECVTSKYIELYNNILI